MRLLPELSCAAALVVPAVAMAAPPAARFEWSLPERFGGEGRIEFRTDPDYIHPSSWAVSFDACSSTPGDAPIVRYDWDLAGLAYVSNETCAMEHPPSVFPTQGPYSITLTVTAADGQTGSRTDTIVIKDLLIVSIGDSYASGEGNPDVPQVIETDLLGVQHVRSEAQWVDREWPFAESLLIAQ